MNEKTDSSLASKCFELSSISDELFNKVNKILGCNVDDCLRENFVWGATDTYFDDYDASVEVIRPKGSEFMTEGQAAQILELGFSCIYESINNKDKARLWNSDGFGECSKREGNETNRLRAAINTLLKQTTNKI